MPAAEVPTRSMARLSRRSLRRRRRQLPVVQARLCCWPLDAPQLEPAPFDEGALLLCPLCFMYGLPWE
jgi:hypothetical protein